VSARVDPAVPGVRTIVMGDPSHFSVKGGANPHTRTRWGRRRHVNRERAIAQWHDLKAILSELGVRIVVVPPDPEQPGLVYPANAGFQSHVDTPEPLAGKIFTLSNLLPTRAGEKVHYARVLANLGMKTQVLGDSLRFEGEADFFPVGERYLLTCGHLERQRFVPSWSVPPWKRVYGFRTDRRVESMLAPMVAPKPVLCLELVLEAHYHGDTALCAFGPKREHLLAYRSALHTPSYAKLEAAFGDAIIELGDHDATRYAANSFTLAQGDDSYLVMPGGVSEELLDRVRERGTTPITVDVSEFLKKGGGSVKCMIGDLGVIADGG